MLKYKMILEAIDRVTGPAKRIRASMKGIGGAAKTMAADVRKVGSEVASVTRLDRGVMHLGRAFIATGRAAKRMAGKAGIGSWGDAAELAGRGVGSLIRKLGGLAVSTLKWGAASAAAAGGFAVFDMLKTAGQFEQFQAMLDRSMGSQKGKAAMGWIQQFAAETPYELGQVTDAFVRLNNLGIDPMDGSLRAAGDAASAMNLDLMDGVEALTDAMTNQFERLKAFGITASTAGQNVTLSWVQNGKAMTRTVKKDAAEMKAALTDIWDQKFGGSMIGQSKTMLGIIANIKDQWSRFLLLVAQAGIFDTVKNKLSQWLDKINEMAKDGRLQIWAQRISDRLKSAFEWATNFVETTNWDNAIRALTTIAKLAGDTMSFLAGAYEKLLAFKRWQAGNLARTYEGVENSWFSSASAKADARKKRQELEAIPGVSLTDSGKREASERSGHATRWKAQQTLPLTPIGQSPYLKKWSTLPAWASPRKTSANDVKVGGKAVVDVRVTGPATARVSSIDNGRSAVPLQVNLGKTMAGAA